MARVKKLLAILFLSLALPLIVFWAVSALWPRSGQFRAYGWGPVGLYRQGPPFAVSLTLLAESDRWLSLWIDQRNVRFTLRAPLLGRCPDRKLSVAGFGYSQRVYQPPVYCGTALEASSERSNRPVRSFQGYGRERSLLLPIWFVSACLCAYPIAFFVIMPLQRGRRRGPGFCLVCGYNLTGLPEPRCPECGAEVPETTIPDGSVVE